MANPNLRATAKIVRFHECGGPEVLKLEEVPTPEPGKGEVRLRVEAIGLNRAEVLFRQGKYLIRSHPPCTLGYEAAGVVEAVGDDVDKQLIGKRFSTVPSFPADKYGVYGEVAIVPAYALAAYPEKLSPEEGASIWMQYLTAYGPLAHLGKVTRGDFVLITAASSSVGVAAIEIAKAQGAISIAATRTSKKKSELLSLGADHVIATQEEDLVKRVGEITSGKGTRVVFDSIGGKGVELLARAAAQYGTIYVYGSLAMEPTPFPLLGALPKGLSMRGYSIVEVVSEPALRTRAEKYVFDHLERGDFKPRIAKKFPLTQIAEAHRYMESNEHVGKIVVTV
ncbi:MAG TPA: zinc-dependent alcohol dehydrogenase family protein [Candidatus Acidoferrales bacterium]|nr:zinc-dependent alcohol dehydrogenase family protein [Candidatus Acidoferrales bacterium]